MSENLCFCEPILSDADNLLLTMMNGKIVHEEAVGWSEPDIPEFDVCSDAHNHQEDTDKLE